MLMCGVISPLEVYISAKAGQPTILNQRVGDCCFRCVRSVDHISIVLLAVAFRAHS